METHTCESLLTIVARQLPSLMTVESTGFGCDVITPLYFPDNTPVTVTIEDAGNDNFIVSDHGAGSDYAFLSGVSDRLVQTRIEMSGRRLGLAPIDDEIRTVVPAEQLATAIFNVANAQLDIAYLMYRNYRPPRRREFRSEILEYLHDRKRHFRTDYQIPGKHRLRTVDFHVLPNGQAGLDFWTLDTTIAQSARDQADKISINYLDIEKVNPDHMDRFAAVVRFNASEPTQVAEEALRMVESYLPHVVLWETPAQLEQLLSGR